MKLNNIVIRSKKQMESMQKEIRDALYYLVRKDNMSVPVVYQYLHKPGVELVVTPENTMGVMTNIRMEDGAIIGDIEIYDILKIASNFTGVIDNFAISRHSRDSNKPVYAFDALIIYDKVAKERILQRKRNMEERLAAPGSVPLVSGDDTGIALQKATKEILADFERRFKNEQSSNNKEGGFNNESK